MYAYCQEMPGVTVDMVARVEAEVGGAPISGLVAHVSGPTENGWRVIDVWETEDDYHSFQRERLNPALQIATRGLAPPQRPFESYAVTGSQELARRV
jgi:hypothetical protein